MGRRDKHLASKAAGRQSAAEPPGKAALRDAEVLQQRAERRKGKEAMESYERATLKYREALGARQHLSAEDLCAAHFGLGETLQEAADTLLACNRAATDAELQTCGASANSAAIQMLEEAVHNYQQVQEAGQPRGDALVNSGNALSSLAALELPEKSLNILKTAVGFYRAALAQEEEAAILVNLADALVSAAERLEETGDTHRSRETYGEAMQVYAKACSMSSSEDGDDLPGLLYNWGVGLQSAGTSLKDRAALEESVAKLKDSASFNRGDAAVFIALGDAFLALAELAGEPAAESALLQRALREGFSPALHIDRNQADAVVGTAEADLQLGKRAEAEQHFKYSFQAYVAALHNPQTLGTFKDRCEIRFNCACAAALSGNHQAAEAALRDLLARQGTTAADILSDNDLSALRSSSLFVELRGSTKLM